MSAVAALMAMRRQRSLLAGLCAEEGRPDGEPASELASERERTRCVASRQQW